jgi:hypothetical protein
MKLLYCCTVWYIFCKNSQSEASIYSNIITTFWLYNLLLLSIILGHIIYTSDYYKYHRSQSSLHISPVLVDFSNTVRTLFVPSFLLSFLPSFLPSSLIRVCLHPSCPVCDIFSLFLLGYTEILRVFFFEIIDTYSISISIAAIPWSAWAALLRTYIFEYEYVHRRSFVVA